jgi:hypothetical protein
MVVLTSSRRAAPSNKVAGGMAWLARRSFSAQPSTPEEYDNAPLIPGIGRGKTSTGLVRLLSNSMRIICIMWNYCFILTKRGWAGWGKALLDLYLTLDVGAAMMWLGRGGGGEGKRLTIIVMLDISKASLNPHKCSFS